MSAAFHYLDKDNALPANAGQAERRAGFEADDLPIEPAAPSSDDSVDLDDFDTLDFDTDDRWDVFIPDDDEIDPQPEPGDFWIEPDE
jgi:hypothetical protein